MTEMVATRDAYGKALVELGRVNENIVVLDADLSKSTKTYAFGQEFPDRFINVGIAEQNLMGVAAGLSTAGKIVFASTFAIFATGRAFEIVRNSIGYPKLNVKICATHSGITVGEDGASHQAIEDISCMRTIPNMTVIVPSDSVETRAVIHAVSKMDGPVYVRLGRLAVPVINDEKSYKFEMGKGVVLNKGDDATIITTGLMVGEALEAAGELETRGIKARVINMHTIKPIDENLIIEAAKETGAIVTAEEHNIIGGLGSAVAEVIGENHPVPLKRIGIKDTFGESGKPAELMKKYGLTSDGIVKAVISLIDRK
ncbi:MAG: transketolase family protein [Natronincolaceae bacterium]|jgi:transketolase|nr:transketolase family protein [Bacillota bacterium]NLK91062.1 transketolase family protein [Clostridiales bacterium]